MSHPRAIRGQVAGDCWLRPLWPGKCDERSVLRSRVWEAA